MQRKKSKPLNTNDVFFFILNTLDFTQCQWIHKRLIGVYSANEHIKIDEVRIHFVSAKLSRIRFTIFSTQSFDQVEMVG